LWGEDKEVTDKRYLKPGIHRDIETHKKVDVYWTAREIMQNYGAFFRTIDNEFWVKNLFKVIEDKEYTNVIITDVRYINEADYIIDNGGYVIRVERENKDTVHNETHPSEVELDDYKQFDFTVVNNWTLDHLKLAASETAHFLKEGVGKKLKEIKING